MKKNNNIFHYCKIERNFVILNDKLILKENESIVFSEFSKILYEKNRLNYPKFFKMDNLSKLALITSEFLLGSYYNKKINDNVSIILSNKSSSLYTDEKFQKTINNEYEFFPSPSIFIYTLPNISIGEICIRNNFTNENIFFISNHFNSKLINEYARSILMNQNNDIALCGWVEFNNNNFKAFMYIASTDILENFDSEYIDNLYI